MGLRHLSIFSASAPIGSYKPPLEVELLRGFCILARITAT